MGIIAEITILCDTSDCYNMVVFKPGEVSEFSLDQTVFGISYEGNSKLAGWLIEDDAYGSEFLCPTCKEKGERDWGTSDDIPWDEDEDELWEFEDD